MKYEVQFFSEMRKDWRTDLNTESYHVAKKEVDYLKRLGFSARLIITDNSGNISID